MERPGEADHRRAETQALTRAAAVARRMDGDRAARRAGRPRERQWPGRRPGRRPAIRHAGGARRAAAIGSHPDRRHRRRQHRRDRPLAMAALGPCGGATPPGCGAAGRRRGRRAVHRGERRGRRSRAGRGGRRDPVGSAGVVRRARQRRPRDRRRTADRTDRARRAGGPCSGGGWRRCRRARSVALGRCRRAALAAPDRTHLPAGHWPPQSGVPARRAIGRPCGGDPLSGRGGPVPHHFLRQSDRRRGAAGLAAGQDRAHRGDGRRVGRPASCAGSRRRHAARDRDPGQPAQRAARRSARDHHARSATDDPAAGPGDAAGSSPSGGYPRAARCWRH